MNRDDRAHGALLILNELVRISSMEGEVKAAAALDIHGRCPAVLLAQSPSLFLSVTAHA